MATTQQNFDCVLKAFTTFQSDLFSAIKPINLITLLGEFFTAPTFKKAVKTFIKILELYDVFWKVTMRGLYSGIKLIVSSLIDISRTCRAFADWIVGLVPRTSDYFKSIFVHEAPSPTLTYLQNVLDEQKTGVVAKTDWLSTLVPIVSGLVMLIGGNLLCMNKTSEWLLKATSTSGNAIAGLVKCFTCSRQIYDGVADSMFEVFGIGNPSAKMQKELAAQQEKEEAEKAIRKLNALCNYLDIMSEQLRKEPQVILSDPEGAMRIKDALITADEMFTEIGNHRFLANQCRPNLETLKFKKVQIQRAYEDLLYSMQGKVLPTTIYFSGQAGVGKSRSIAALVDRLSFFENRQLSTYTRSAGVKHWDSYTGQDVVIYDDFGQHAENVDHGELDAIYTNASYVLPMASIENKGMRFTSPYLIICSNFERIEKSKIITDPTVLNRRRDFFFKVEDPVHAELVAQGKQMGDEFAARHYKKDFSHLQYTPMERLPNENGHIVRRVGYPYGTLYSMSRDMFEMKKKRVKEFQQTNMANVAAFIKGQPKLTELVPSPIVQQTEDLHLAPLKLGLQITIDTMMERIESAPPEFTFEQVIHALQAPEQLRDAIAEEPITRAEAQQKIVEITKQFTTGFRVKWFNEHMPGGCGYNYPDTVSEVIEKFRNQHPCFFCSTPRTAETFDCTICKLPSCHLHRMNGVQAERVKVKYSAVPAAQKTDFNTCCHWLFETEVIQRLIKAHGMEDPASIFNESADIYDGADKIGLIQPLSQDPAYVNFHVISAAEIAEAMVTPKRRLIEEIPPPAQLELDSDDDEFQECQPEVIGNRPLFDHDGELNTSIVIKDPDNIFEDLNQRFQVLMQQPPPELPQVIADLVVLPHVPIPDEQKPILYGRDNLKKGQFRFATTLMQIPADVHETIVDNYLSVSTYCEFVFGLDDGQQEHVRVDFDSMTVRSSVDGEAPLELILLDVQHQTLALVEVPRMPIILLLGEPGTGKTSILKQFTKDPFYECIDEITTTPAVLQYAVDAVWKLYDYPGDDSGIIMTANPATLERMMLSQYDKDKYAAFMRRCVVYDFTFRRRGLFNMYKKYTVDDIAPGHYAGCIKLVQRGADQIEVSDLIAELRKHPIKVEKQTVFLDFPKIATIDFIPDIHIKLAMNCKTTMRKPLMSDFTFERGMSHIALFLKIYRKFGDKKWTSIHTALQGLSVENLEVGAVYTLLFELEDVSFLVTTAKTGPLKIEEIEDLPDFDDIETQRGIETWKNIAFYLEAIFALSKDALAIWVIYDDIKEAGEDVRNRKIAQRLDKVNNEMRWGSEDEEEDEDDGSDQYHNVPAWAVQSTAQVNASIDATLANKKKPKSALEDKGRETLGSDPSLPKKEYRNRVAAESRRHTSFQNTYQTEILGPRTNAQAVITDLKKNSDNIELALQHNRRIIDQIRTPLNTGTPPTLHAVNERECSTAILPESGTANEAEGRNGAPHVRRKKVTIAATKDSPKKTLFEDPKKLGHGATQIDIEFFRNENIVDKTALDVADLCITNTVYVLNDKGEMTCRALMLGGRRGLSVAHLLPGQMDEQMTSTNFDIKCSDGTVYSAKIERVNYERDWVTFVIDKTAREFRNIIPHFMKRGDTKDLRGYKGFLNIVTFRGNRNVIAYQRPVDLQVNVEYTVDDFKKNGLSYVGRMDSFSMTSAVTTFGDCGSPLMLLDTSSARKIIGIHSAASYNTSIASIVYQEDISEFQNQCALPEITFLKCNAITPITSGGTYCGFPIVGKTILDGKIVKQNCPVTTELYTGPFYELTKKNFEPCLLSSKDSRNPGHDFIHTGPQKWNHPQPEIDEELLQEVVDAWADFYAFKFKAENLRNKVLTKTESINGVSFVPGSNPIFRHSSAGYPYKHFTGVVQKTTFFQQRDDLLWVISKSEHGKILQDAVDRIIDCAHTSRPGCAFICSLKDEPRKLGKIYGDNPGTRTFAAASLDYTIAQRMYFHTAAACFTACFNDLPPKIGIDSKSLDWNCLYFYHTEVSTVGFDMDFKDWDATVPLKFMQALPLIYNRIYQETDPDWTPIDDVIRYNLHSVVHGPLLIIDDTVVQAPGGQVSGQPLTALDNSLVNCMYSYYIFRKLAPPHMQNFTAYLKNVRTSVYGDDNMTTVHPSILEWFNFETYKIEAEKLNLNITPANKGDKTFTHQDIMELSFLKQNFVRMGPWILGKPELSSIEKMLSFTRGTRNHKWDREREVVFYDPEIIGMTIDEALHFAMPHGLTFFNLLRKSLQQECARRKIRHDHFPTFAEVVRMYIKT